MEPDGPEERYADWTERNEAAFAQIEIDSQLADESRCDPETWEDFE